MEMWKRYTLKKGQSSLSRGQSPVWKNLWNGQNVRVWSSSTDSFGFGGIYVVPIVLVSVVTLPSAVLPVLSSHCSVKAFRSQMVVAPLVLPE